jgi:hypothetical protein
MPIFLADALPISARQAMRVAATAKPKLGIEVRMA